MKKQAIFLLLGMIFLAGFVFAQPYNQSNLPVNHTEINAGLSRALEVVNSTTAIAHITDNIARISQQDSMILNELNSTKAYECPAQCVIVSGSKPALLFGIFPLQKSYTYQVDDNGTVYQIKNIFDIFWKE